MANSSRDPYWQASVRRETIDHPEATAEIQDECSVCHMPIVRYEAMLAGTQGRDLFAPAARPRRARTAAKRRTACRARCATRSANRSSARARASTAGFVLDAPDAKDNRPEYGPFEVGKGHNRIMRTSSEGYRPTKSDHIRSSEVCATCHTLLHEGARTGRQGRRRISGTDAVPGVAATANIRTRDSCQSCHMPVVEGAVPITRVLGDAARGSPAARLRRRELFHAADAESLSRRPGGHGAQRGADQRRPTGRSRTCNRRRRGSRWPRLVLRADGWRRR